jgi:hypothetical protein
MRRRGALAGWAPLAAAATLLTACTAAPAEYFHLSPEAPAHKAAQTRFFATRDADELLSASAAVLQDLGFHVDESVRELGFLRATKERSARESGQQWLRALVLIASFGYVLLPIDLQQQIGATLVASPVGDDGTRHEVRVMFHRVVWQGDGQAGRNYVPPGAQRAQMIRDPVVYQQFFAKLSKAVFLEAFTL